MGVIVITGSQGLVGSAVVSYVLSSSNHDLVLVDARPALNPSSDPRVTHILADLTKYEAWDFMAGADALIHLAGYAQPYLASSSIVMNGNCTLSWNALRAAVDAGVKRIVLAGSINAIGGCYSKNSPLYHYFPLDEQHPTLAEDAYSLSKYILEIQADGIARSHPEVSIASIRMHAVRPEVRNLNDDIKGGRKDLWGWSGSVASARACLLALEKEPGHEVFYIVGEEHCCPGHDAQDLAKQYYPDVPLRPKLEPTQSFFSSAKAERILGWKHEGGREPTEW